MGWVERESEFVSHKVEAQPVSDLFTKYVELGISGIHVGIKKYVM